MGIAHFADNEDIALRLDATGLTDLAANRPFDDQVVIDLHLDVAANIPLDQDGAGCSLQNPIGGRQPPLDHQIVPILKFLSNGDLQIHIPIHI